MRHLMKRYIKFKNKRKKRIKKLNKNNKNKDWIIEDLIQHNFIQKIMKK